MASLSKAKSPVEQEGYIVSPCAAEVPEWFSEAADEPCVGGGVPTGECAVNAVTVPASRVVLLLRVNGGTGAERKSGKWKDCRRKEEPESGPSRQIGTRTEI